MSVVRTIPRGDAGARRRSWSREQKTAIVAEIAVGGATLSEMARRHALNVDMADARELRTSRVPGRGA